MNPLAEYYVNQAGTGLSGFSGLRYQRGNGWFTNILSRVGLPILKFLGKQALSSGLNIASDALEGKAIKESALSEIKNTGRNTLGFIKQLADQSGSGRKRKKARRTTSIKRRRTNKKQAVSRKRRRNKYVF